MSARITDLNGWYEIRDNPLSKVGIFPYLGKSINAPEPNRFYNVFRPMEELSDPDTLNSFCLVPFIDDHVMLGSKGIPAEQKGVEGVIGERVWFDQSDLTMKGNIKVFSDNLQDKISDGKIELSLGYVCHYDPTPGIYNGQPYDYVQRRIRGNHMALVTDGRMGSSVSVMDTITFDAKDFTMTVVRNEKWTAFQKKKLAAMTDALKTKTVIAPSVIAAMDAEETEAGAPTLEDIAALFAEVTPQLADINNSIASIGGDDDMEDVMDASGKPVMDAAGKPMRQKKGTPANPANPGNEDKTAMDQAAFIAAMDAAIAKAVAPLQTEIASLKSGGAKELMTQVAHRNVLAEKLSHFVGAFDHAEMTLSEVAQYGVKKLEIPTVDGQEITSVNAWLHGRTVPVSGKATIAMDGKAKAGGSIAKYLTGE